MLLRFFGSDETVSHGELVRQAAKDEDASAAAKDSTGADSENKENKDSEAKPADWHTVQRRPPRSRKSSECISVVEGGEERLGTEEKKESSEKEKEEEEMSMDDMEELDFTFSHESSSHKATHPTTYNPKVSHRARNVSVVLHSFDFA